MIVLHRRGTTGEWQQADVLAEQLLATDPSATPAMILKNGELAIEEHDNGARFVKIGDGYSKFEDLPYIDERAESIAETNLQETKKALLESIAKAEIRQQQYAHNIKSELENVIKSSGGAVTSENVSKLEGSVKAIDETLNTHLTSAETNTRALRQNISDISYELTQEIKPAVTALENKLSKETAARIAQDNSNFDELAALVSAKVLELTALLKATDATLTGKINALDLRDTDAITNVIKQLESIQVSIESLSSADSDLLARIYSVDNSLTHITNQLSNELSILGIKQTADRDVLLDELSKQENARASADCDIVTALLDFITKIYAELADLVDDDVFILTKVYELENSLPYKVAGIFDEKLAVQAEDFTRAVDEVSTATDRKFAQTHELITTLDAELEETKSVIDVQAARIDNLVSYAPEGYEKDQELVDLRTDYKGGRHASASKAVHVIGQDLIKLENSLEQYIGTQAVTGLHYDIKGEVGLQQPYMLYLKAGDEVIQESGVQVVGGAGGGGGGTASSKLSISYITTSPLIITPTDEAILYFNFSGTDSSGDTIKQANAAWKVNGLTVEYSKVRDGVNEFDITKYIKTGTTKVFLTVTDDNGSVATKSWDVQLVELGITSNFNDRIKYAAGEPIIFDYTPTGAVEKTVIFKLDNNEIGRVTLGKEISGSAVSYELPPQVHGAHLLEVYMEAFVNANDAEPTTSNHIIKDIMWYDPNGKIPVISSTPHSLKVKQYATTNIIYTVYDPLDENPKVTIKVDDAVVATPTVTPNKDYDGTTTAIYPYSAASAGAHIIKIICGNAEKAISVFVEDIGVDISPVTTGLAFDFNPAGRSNSDANRLWSHNNVHLTVSDNFDWINGGYIPDEQDGPCFCIKAGSSATIDYKLFENEAKVYGKEFKLIFKTKNVSNPEAVFLSCIDNTTDKDHIGLVMGAHSANIYGKNGNLELAYSEEDAIEFEFNISKNTEAVPMVMGYEDGVPSRPMVYDSTFSFQQNTPKTITLGSPDCDLYIYRFKVYNTSLSNVDILKNFIADARTAEDMISRHNRNQIYDENKMLTAESVASSCPWLRVYKVSAPHFTNSKSDKVSNTTIQQIHAGGDPVLDNWIAHNAQHSGQGTSSNNYGAAGRNLDFIMNKSSSYFELGDGSTADKITLTRESVPVAYLNAKVNIASSNNLTNAILANRYNKFNPYRRPFVRVADLADEFTEDELDKMSDSERAAELVKLQAKVDSELAYIKDTMEFYNCVIFIQETDPDLSTHREFADNDWHFYAIGNIGDSKKTDNTRLTDIDDPYECCVEIMDVDLPLSAFPRDTMMDAMSYDIDETTEERVYTWAKDSNLGILYEKQADGSYVLTSDTTVDYEKTYYVDILLHDDFSEDYTYGWRYISDDENTDIVNTCKQAWIDFYRFVTTSSNEEFKANLKNYFVVDSALYYYLFTTRYCMVDNRAKNTFWHYGKTADGTRKWDLCWDYDNDTSLGLNNYGKQLYRYGLEDIDFDNTGTEVFRQSDSLFFCRIRDLFGAELKNMYQTLESKDAWNASTLIKESDDWQEQFPEELWRVDIERKYIRTYTKSFITGAGDKQFLTNMSNGRMKYHRRNWERNQEAYMASKYQTTAAMSEDAHANFRVRRFDSTDDLVVKPNYQFTLTPYSYIYLNVYYNSGSPISVRAEPNVPTVVPYSGTNADIINVGSAAAIKDFGDLSALYPDTVSVQNASRARVLKIGNSTEGYKNTGFSAFTTGANNLLDELDITNTSYNKSLTLGALVNLKKVYAFGTEIPSVIFAEGGKMQYAELPALNNIELKNLQYLATENFKLSSYNYVVDLTVVGCPLINQLALLEACTKVRRVKLDNINFGTKTYEYFEEKIFNLSGADTDKVNAQITGTVHFENLTGAQFNELKSRYPNLTISYDLLTSVITFKDTDNESTKYERTILNAGDCEDPATAEGWTIPIIPAEQEFRYEWFGWSTDKNIMLNYEHMDENVATEAELADYAKYRVDSIKHVEGDRVLYPVFKVIRQEYEVQFINPADNNKVLYSVMVPYDYDADYIGGTPQKLDSQSPEVYEFIGWYPIPENIVDTLNCYAQFTVKDQDRLPSGEDDGDTLPGYTIGWLDISDNGTEGYSLNAATKTMDITMCYNKYNPVIRIPESLEQGNVSYAISGLGGFDGHNYLEIVYFDENSKVKTLSSRATGTIGTFSNCTNLAEIALPAELTTISAKAFVNCQKLTKINIPAKVTSIADDVFTGCPLESITVDAANTYYEVINDCLLRGKGLSSGKTLIKGLSTGIIPNDGTVNALATYCFAKTNITSAVIPASVYKIASNAFRECAYLETLILHEGLTELSSSCFSKCRNIKNITLPTTVKTIGTYAFSESAISDLIIPAATNSIQSNAFGSIANLTEVTFIENRDNAGNVIVPTIAKAAFSNSGSTEGVRFNVPWSMNYDYAAVDSAEGWGAKKWTIYYSDGWRNSAGESSTY